MYSLPTLALALSAASFAAAGPANIEARATKSSSGSASGTGSTSLPTVTTKGNAFFAGDDRFYIRGVDYQPGGSSDVTDPLADYSTCSRDIPYSKKLGLNTIRVYTVDNSADHDQCMNALAEAGIYLALDVNTPKYSLNRGSLGVSYNPTYLQSIFATVDAFAGYTNTLLFFSGNEVINDSNSTSAAPYVKAVTRDMKQNISERGYRSIPVGYSAADVSQNQYLMAQYMDCGDTPSIFDFYAINNYEWCDPSSYTTSGWSALVEQYSNYSLPLFISEYGCITNTRTFAETAELYKSEMTKVFSGGLVYEYSAEGNGYGIVTISGNTVTSVDSQFDDLKSALANATDPTDGGGYFTDGKVQDCPDQSDNWDTSAFTDSALPAMPTGAEKYMKSGAGDGPGLTGDGSQNAGGGSSATASAGAGAVSTTYGSGAAGATGSTASSAAGAVQIGRTDLAPLVCGAVVFVSILLGAAML
ncbi:1,3-beta-glucanosyltransferase gel1 [Fulvia fulva]|uniref:1,3-beta-glucanosyltransferase n=1 Tax=Passalora fulva TaxID=5499 RepID=A0A9Q8L9Q8_PASFU|nr:1,3-beta-glucanosyltransferase gel1 [Fulvia fulva]KAK4633409.1 1,3-beta-glucanosyltransferase gel1 [Fulvia fulva]UJO13392.1 1,3-beta-glucanosyltransferase gel1 [Fulvia fulva]WPV11797.1 1,3-beta-glucanosyltransferase gel1 [Fulvia fulva]